jgi:hypothetical protein
MQFDAEMPEPPKVNWGAQVLNCVRRCPTFPPGLGSIIGAGRLSFRVRDGSGRFPAAMAAVTLVHPVVGVGVCLVVGCRGVSAVGLWLRAISLFTILFVGVLGVVVSFRPVSASSLQPLLVF